MSTIAELQTIVSKINELATKLEKESREQLRKASPRLGFAGLQCSSIGCSNLAEEEVPVCKDCYDDLMKDVAENE